jgi:hypothetical protein
MLLLSHAARRNTSASQFNSRRDAPARAGETLSWPGRAVQAL